jgi:DNA invertase Pin-like site-specific DNA recombinase
VGQDEEEGKEEMSNKKRAAVYIRVSTAEQETAMQEAELREYCERRGWELKVYKDHGQSGAKSDRPALNTLLADMRRRKIDVLVVWALDRLARSLRQLLTIAEECRSLGVDLVSLKQNVDTTLPAGRLTFQVLGAVAEFEREMLRERVRAGMAQARRAGKNVGRPAKCKPIFSEIEKMNRFRLQGASIRQLAAKFGTTQWMAARLTSSELTPTGKLGGQGQCIMRERPRKYLVEDCGAAEGS